jgi:hypothetical protein
MSDLILPASINDWQASSPVTRVPVHDDAQNVVRDLKAIDAGLCVEYDTAGEFFVVFFRNGPEEQLVLTARQLDQRIVRQVREIDQPDYDFAAEVDKHDAAVDRQNRHEFAEEMGEKSDKLAWAIRKDLGSTNRIFIPADLNARKD